LVYVRALSAFLSIVAPVVSVGAIRVVAGGVRGQSLKF